MGKVSIKHYLNESLKQDDTGCYPVYFYVTHNRVSYKMKSLLLGYCSEGDLMTGKNLFLQRVERQIVGRFYDFACSCVSGFDLRDTKLKLSDCVRWWAVERLENVLKAGGENMGMRESYKRALDIVEKAVGFGVGYDELLRVIGEKKLKTLYDKNRAEFDKLAEDKGGEIDNLLYVVRGYEPQGTIEMWQAENADYYKQMIVSRDRVRGVFNGGVGLCDEDLENVRILEIIEGRNVCGYCNNKTKFAELAGENGEQGAEYIREMDGILKKIFVDMYLN